MALSCLCAIISIYTIRDWVSMWRTCKTGYLEKKQVKCRRVNAYLCIIEQVFYCHLIILIRTQVWLFVIELSWRRWINDSSWTAWTRWIALNLCSSSSGRRGGSHAVNLRSALSRSLQWSEERREREENSTETCENFHKLLLQIKFEPLSLLLLTLVCALSRFTISCAQLHEEQIYRQLA